MQAGFSLVLRDIPKRCLVVGRLAEALEGELGLPAGANLYLTPQGVWCLCTLELPSLLLLDWCCFCMGLIECM